MAKQQNSDWTGTMLIAIYKVLLSLFLVAFVGVGIAAFYPEPRMPDALIYTGGPLPTELQPVARAYHDAMARYNRDVSIIAAVAAIAILVLSLTGLRRIAIFSDGFLLGGLLTFVYSILRGFGVEDNMFRFVIVSIGLVIALGLGYIRFVRPLAASSKAGAGNENERTAGPRAA
jgi:hypothetical protein